MDLKRVPVVFNLSNEWQKELYYQCEEKFRGNLSGGIRSVLFAFFNGGFSGPQMVESNHSVNEMESVL